MRAIRAILTVILAGLCAAAHADTITWLWDDFNGSYKAGFNGFIEESFKVGDAFATHYYIGDSVHCLAPHTGTDQAQSFQYYKSSNDNNFVTYFETKNDATGSYTVDLVGEMAKRGQDPIDLTMPITYRVRVYGHNDAYDPNDPSAYWKQVMGVREPSSAGASILWTGANNDTWQTLEVTQTGLENDHYQWITFESWYPEFYGAMINDTSYMNFENLEIEYTPLPPQFENLIVVADSTDVPGGCHVENEARTFGLRCHLISGITVAPHRGDRVNLWGVYEYYTPEPVFRPTTVKVLSSGNALPRPLAMNQRSLGGQPRVPASQGPNNVGLLARICGRVTEVKTGYFYIDDGSGLAYASPISGVKIYGAKTGLQKGQYVVVTGIVGAETAVPSTAPVFRTRNEQDITVLP